MKIAIYADDYTGNRGISIVGHEILSRLLKISELNFLVIGTNRDIEIFNQRFQLNADNNKSVSYCHYKNDRSHFIRKKLLDYILIKEIDIFWYMKNYGTYRFKKNAEVLVTVHDLMGYIKPELQGGKVTLGRTLRRIINIGTLTFADNLNIVSKSTAHELMNKLNIDSRKITVIPNGVDIQNFIPQEKEKIIFYSGAFNFYKNVDFLIESFVQTTLADYGWKFILAGPSSKIKGCLKSEIMKKYTKNPNIEILPEVSDYRELNKVYKKAFCLISASAYEGFGLSLLEGMSSGSYIIASDIKPHEEIADNSPDCFLLSLEDKQKWIKTLNNLEKIYNKVGSEYNRNIAKKYSWDNVSQEYHRVLKDIYAKRL